MQLIRYPSQILLKVCKSVLDSGKGQRRKDRLILANKMWKIMNDNHGIGLAAPQVGLDIRMFVWNYYGSQVHNQAIWNPVLVHICGFIESTEGCLSLPGVNVTLQRATSSVLSGTGINGKPVGLIGNSITTRIWQHEIDHLDGKLIIDNMSLDDKNSNKGALRELLKNHGQ